MPLEALEQRRLLAGEPWGTTARLVNLDEAIETFPQINGSGQVVVVIDTGVDARHPALAGKVIGGWDFVDNDSDPTDPVGHGTGVAGVIAADEFVFSGSRYRGVASGARIIALRVDEDGASQGVTNRRIEQALQWVLARLSQYNIASINLSFGSGSHTSPVSLDPFGDELTALYNAGVFIAAASGNEGVSSPAGIDYPGAHPNVFAIGSVSPGDVISTFTQRSSQLDLLAPGEDVPTTFPSGGSFVYLRGTGTSFAVPHAAAAAALLKQANPGLTPDQIISILKSTGTPNFDGDRETGRVTNLTFARLDLEQAIASALGAQDDRFESNDTISAAPTVAQFGSSGGTATVGALKLAAGDVDFFELSLSAPNRVQFSLSVSSGATPSFELFNAGGSKVSDLANGRTFDLTGGSYFVRLSGSKADYSLSFSATPDDSREANNSASAATSLAEGAVLSSLRLLSNNADYYTFSIGSRTEVSITFDRSALGGTPSSAELLNSSEGFVASLNNGQTRLTLSPGRYYIRIRSSSSFSGTYRLGYDALAASGPPVLTGTHHDFAFDRAGAMHLAYFDYDSKNLKYVTRSASGVWSNVITIDKSPDTGQHVSLAIDGKGRVAVAYYDSRGRDLKYAISGSSGFSIRTIDSSGTVGEYASLAFNADNRPAISYYRRTRGDLRFAQMGKSGRWSITTVDGKNDTGQFTSLALSPRTNRFSIAYVNPTRGAFMYAENTKRSNWSVRTVDDTKNGGGHVSLAFDSSFRPAFSYHDASGADLRFARLEKGRWKIQEVSTSGQPGLFSNLIFNGTQPSIYHYNKSQGAVFLAVSQKGRWNVRKVNDRGGGFLTAAKSPFGDTFISWEDRGVLRDAKM